MKALLEKDILAQIRDYLRLTGWLVIRLNSGAVPARSNGRRRFIRFNDTPGCSDLLALRGGVVLLAEIKRPGGRATAAQQSFLEEVRRHGGLGLVVDGLDSLRQQLEEQEC